jgi:hypothetical protein
VKENGVIAIDPNTKKPKQSEDELTYFSNMSRAMARHCDEYASLMTEKTKDPSKIPMAGIWGTVEFPELKLDKNDGGKVDLVSMPWSWTASLKLSSLLLTTISADRLFRLIYEQARRILVS